MNEQPAEKTAAGGRGRSWREGDGPIGAEDIIRFLSQVVRGKIGGKKPATVTERIRAATVLLKLYQDGEILCGEEAEAEEDALSRAVREYEEEGLLRRLRFAAEEEAERGPDPASAARYPLPERDLRKEEWIRD